MQHSAYTHQRCDCQLVPSGQRSASAAANLRSICLAGVLLDFFLPENSLISTVSAVHVTRTPGGAAAPLRRRRTEVTGAGSLTTTAVLPSRPGCCCSIARPTQGDKLVTSPSRAPRRSFSLPYSSLRRSRSPVPPTPTHPHARTTSTTTPTHSPSRAAAALARPCPSWALGWPPSVACSRAPGMGIRGMHRMHPCTVQSQRLHAQLTYRSNDNDNDNAFNTPFA